MKSNIKCMIFDVDGTLTDGKIYMGNDGEIMKAFSAHDAVGIRKLPEVGIKTIIITGRSSDIVTHRAMEMNITEVYQGIGNKLELLKTIMERDHFSFENFAYMGDDENDYECMKECAIRVCPGDATSKIKSIATYICTKNGGEGAAREFIEHFLKEVAK